MADFTFTQIATPGYRGYQSFSNPSINNDGKVVFEAFRAPLGVGRVEGGPPGGIFAGSGGTPPTPVAEVTPNGFSVVYNPSISDAGTTAFVGNILDADFSTLPPIIRGLRSSGVYSSGSDGFNNVSISAPGGFAFLNSADINSAGTVTFAAGFSSNLNNPTGGISNLSGGIYTGTTTGAGQVRVIADTSATFSSFTPGLDTVINNSPYSEFTYPTINESGTVAFTGFLNEGGSGIFSVGTDGQLTTIAESNNDIFNLFSSAQINNKGEVAFTSELDTGGRGVFVGSSEGYKTIADSSGPFNTFFSDPSINDLGQVAFLADLDSGLLGIFNGPDPIANKVIGVGDDLAGSKVVYINVHEEGLNNAGQIAFEAELQDAAGNRSYTVFRAEPVPEPVAGISMLALGILFMLGWRWRHQRQFSKPAQH